MEAKRAVRNVRLVTWNILAHTYVDNCYEAGRFDHINPAFKAKDYRLALQRDHITRMAPDILCLQEVDLLTFQDDFGTFFGEKGYENVLQDHKKKREDHVTGNAIFFRKDLFSLHTAQSRSRTMFVGLRPLWLDDARSTATSEESSTAQHEEKIPDVSSMPSEAPEVTAAAPISDQPQNPKKDNPKKKKQPPPPSQKLARVACLWVGNVHLEGHPLLSPARLSQVKSLLTKLRLQQQQSEPVALQARTILCGDFNSEISGGIYRFLADGKIEPTFQEYGVQVAPSTTSHEFKFKEAVGAAFPFPPGPFATYSPPSHHSVLDFVWFTPETITPTSTHIGLNREGESPPLSALAAAAAAAVAVPRKVDEKEGAAKGAQPTGAAEEVDLEAAIASIMSDRQAFRRLSLNLPNEHHPSDHVPVIVDLKITF